ncbi:MAG: RNA polymerase sigma factor [Myxococcota bacterium]
MESSAKTAGAKVVPLRPHDGRSDAELVTAFLGGDQRCIEVLYRRYAPDLLALASRLSGSDADADDAVHDGWLKAMRRLRQLKDPHRFSFWLRTIVVNECRLRLRRRRRMHFFRRHETPDEVFETMASRASSPEVAADLRRVAGLLEELTAEERTAWCLRVVEGYSLEETAALCACSLATIKRRLQRATNRIGRLAGGAP